MPAQQRLESVHATSLELHDRLEHQAQLAALERVPQVGLHAETGLGRVAHRNVEHLEARAPLLLGLIHREVRVTQQVDRKSTRLNSSHSQISYAVFCLKKKKTSYVG